MRVLQGRSSDVWSDLYAFENEASREKVLLYKDFEESMRSEWELIARQANYDSALTQWQEYLNWRATHTPSKTLQPLGEDDVPAKLINNWLVGCDPEFVVMDKNGRVVNTDGILPHTGVVGWDHSGDVVEIRPEPAHGTYALVKRLQKEIIGNPHLAKLSEYKWRAGAYVRARVTRLNSERILTLGGHVHIDQPPADGHGEDQERHDLRIQALDRVTDWMEKLDVLPSKECGERRNDPTAIRNHYGQWSDWRVSGNEGSRRRMEYRTMCSWLFDPKVTYLALTLAKIAAAQPQLTIEGLKKGQHSWEKLGGWLEAYRFRDANVRRALEKMWEGKKPPKVNPDCNFRERWTELGI